MPKIHLNQSTNDDDYEKLEDYNPTRKRKTLTVFDDMIADIKSNKKLSLIVTELLLREKKLNITLVFISQSYFKVPKTIRLNATHCFIMKIPNKRELQEIASNHSYDTDLKDLTKLQNNYTKESYYFFSE